MLKIGFLIDTNTTFNRQKVELIDRHGKGVSYLTSVGFVVAGVEYPVFLSSSE
jgi:hypothetical protein